MSFWVAGAIGGSALLGYFGSQSAANTQAGGQIQAAQTQQHMFDTINAQEQPFIQAGYGATSALNQLLGIAPPNAAPAGAPGGGWAGGASGGTIGGMFGPNGPTSTAMPGGGGIGAGTGGTAGIAGLLAGGPTIAQFTTPAVYGPSGWGEAPGVSAGTAPQIVTPSSFNKAGYDAALAKYNASQNPTASSGGQVQPTGPGGTVGGTGLPAGYLTSPFSPTQQTLNNYPGYQFALQTGGQAVRNADTPGVGALSGPALKDLMNFNVGTANQFYGQYFNQDMAQKNAIFGRLSGIAGLGQNAATQTGTAGATLGTGVAQAQAAAAGSQAAGIVGSTNSIANAGIPLAYLLAGNNTGGGGGGGGQPGFYNQNIVGGNNAGS